MSRYANDHIPFRTRPEDARLDSPLVTLPSGTRVPALDLADGTAPVLENGMFLRASLAREDVAAALAQFDLVPITAADYYEMAIVGLWTPPITLVHDTYDQAHMSSLGYSQEHDARWWQAIERLHMRDPLNRRSIDRTFEEYQTWIDNLTLPILCAKTHAAGPSGIVDRMVGFDKTDDHRPDLIQEGTRPNHPGDRLVHDYGTKTRGKARR